MKLITESLSKPPAIGFMGLQHSGKTRYAANAAVSTVITFANLLDSWLVATSATAGVQLFDMVKINSIEVWSWSPSGPVTCTVTFAGKAVGLTGDSKVVTDTAMANSPAHIVAKPGRRSLAGDWQASNTNTAFTIICPSGSVIDLNFSYRNSYEGGALINTTQALVGAVAGDLYVRGFDGLATAATKVPPQGIFNVQ